MRTILLSVVSLAASAALVACGGKSTGSSTPTGASGSRLEVGEITVFDGDQPMLKIHANGSTEMGSHHGKLEVTPGQTASTDSLPVTWTAGPTIGTDGTLSMNGAAVLQVKADGSIVDLKDSQPVPVTLQAETATVVDNGKSFIIGIGPDGVLTVAGGPAPSGKLPRVEGASTPGQRRTTLALIALMLGGRQVEISTPATAGAPAPAPSAGSNAL